MSNEIPEGGFVTTLMDPPWPERGGGKIKRGADKHYDLISTKAEMLATVILAPNWCPADNSHLYMWVTNNYLPWGLWLYEALGFRYLTNLPWTKRRMGIGQYFRGCHELLLFGVRGSGKDVCKQGTCRTDALEGIEPTQHSKKPEQAYALIEARSLGPYAELFARNKRPGWVSWGNELE